MRHTLFLSLLLLFCGGAVKAASETTLKVAFTDGMEMDFAFISGPQMAFAGNTLTISTSGSGNAGEWAVGNVAYWSFDTKDDIAAARTAATVSFGSNSVTVRTAAGQTARVLSTDGRTQLCAAASADGTATLQLSSLAPGSYVLCADGKSVKFAVRH